jgi:hypothetical protein
MRDKASYRDAMLLGHGLDWLLGFASFRGRLTIPISPFFFHVVPFERVLKRAFFVGGTGQRVIQ